MNTSFEIRPDINNTELYIKDTSCISEDIVISRYEIEYFVYDKDAPNTELIYSYTVDDAVDVATLPSGLYIPISYFSNSGNEEIPSSLEDGVYSFNIKTYYVEVSDIENELSYEYESYKYFYQHVMNVYTQIHLDYNWTLRYKESTQKLITIAEEMTWIDSLKISAQLGKMEEFNSVLEHLTNYFTVTYGY